jgi:hypothetical protein
MSVGRTFSAAAGRLAGIIPRTLGWQPSFFWEATPAELAAIFAAEEEPQGAPLTRSELVSLMERERNG